MDILESMIFGSKGGATPSGTVNITENGTYDVTDKASAVVAVPQPSGSITITTNGTHDVSDKASAVVNVPQQVEGMTWADVFTGNYSNDIVIDFTGYTTQPSITDGIFKNANQSKRINSITIYGNNPVGFANSCFMNNTNIEFIRCNAPISSILGYAFQECSVLGEVFFGNTGRIASNAFRSFQCDTIKFGDITEAAGIESQAFRSSKIASFDAGSITKIGYMAFESSSLLTRFVIRGTGNIPTLSTNVFDSTPIASGTGYIYVPSAMVSQYQAATNWSAYASQFRALEDYTIDGTITGALDPSKI